MTDRPTKTLNDSHELIDWDQVMPGVGQHEDGSYEGDPAKFRRAVITRIRRDIEVHRITGATTKGQSIEMLSGYLLAVKEMAQLVDDVGDLTEIDELQQRLRRLRKGAYDEKIALMGKNPPDEVMWPNLPTCD